MMMGTASVSSTIASSRASPWPRQIPARRSCKNEPQTLVPYSLTSLMRLDTPPRLSGSVKGERLMIMPTERFSFGAVESRFQGRLGLVSSRSTVARAQKEDKEDLEIGKAANKSTESWASSIQRVIPASRIFVASLVWIGLFFMITIMNSETGGGGRPGRRGPRK